LGFFQNLRGRLGHAAAGSTTRRPHTDAGGDEWTPDETQIAAARQRQKSRRANFAWTQLVSGPRLDAARVSIVCATEASDNPDERAMGRPLRALVLDPEVKIFARNMRISSHRYLIELRHSRLNNEMSQAPNGFRFIGLTPNEWWRRDHVGLLLDGEVSPISKLFASNLNETIQDADLAETYIRFIFDNVKFGDEQIYVVSDSEDFFLSSDPSTINASGGPDPFLTAQFRVAVTRHEAQNKDEPEKGVLSEALQADPNTVVVPPTFLRTVPASGAVLAHAVVFTTVIFRGQLYHVCWTVSADGQINPAGQERRYTAEGVTLPLVAIRSFTEQRAALKRAVAELNHIEL
jgi:hypothetical protein